MKGLGGGGLPTIQRVSGEWFYPLVPGGSASSSSGNNNEMRLAPWIADSSFTLSSIQMDIITAGEAGCTLRPLIYSDNGNWTPLNLLLDAGPLPADAIGVPAITGLSTPITAGIIYWLGALSQNAPTTRPTIRTAPLYTPVTPSLRWGISTGPPTTNSTPIGYLYGGIVSPPSPIVSGQSTANFVPRLALRAA